MALQSNLLLFVATETELQELAWSASYLGIPFEEQEDSRVGDHYKLGVIGDYDVIAVKTEMGAFDFQGSAYQANMYRISIGATEIVQVGMAFGIDPRTQRIGDILVSTSLFPYDRRDVGSRCVLDRQSNEIRTEIFEDYSKTPRGKPKSSLVNMFRRAERLLSYRCHFGTLLLGQARIHTRLFRDRLKALVPPKNGHPLIGGEMACFVLKTLQIAKV